MTTLCRALQGLVSSVALIGLLIGATSVQAASPVRISLSANKTSYAPGEAIKIQINVENGSGGDVITRAGFLAQPFHLALLFIGPDGLPIHTRFTGDGIEPGPPLLFQTRPAVVVEIVLAGTQLPVVMDDARFYYDLSKTGRYTVKALVPLETFPQFTESPDTGGRFSFLDDPGRLAFNPIDSNTVAFEIVPSQPIVHSQIQAEVNLLQIGGGSRPEATKTPLESVPVRLIRQADVPADLRPINFKTYEIIYTTVDPVASQVTNSRGQANFEGIEQDNYVVIALFAPDQDFKHMGSVIDATDSAWGSADPIQRRLTVMQKANGKRVPGRTTQRTGSLLLITEPEYILWDSEQELYPFVFESVGNWNVTTSISPPEGFVADHNSLTAAVVDRLAALQFTLTDVGSRWEETALTYTIRHQGRSETIRSKIGVKLSERVAKEKGLGRYGHTGNPGPFKGGRKMKGGT
jgi:hypothetical protein